MEPDKAVSFTNLDEFYAYSVAHGQGLFKHTGGQLNPVVVFYKTGWGTAATMMRHMVHGNALEQIVDKIMKTPHDYFCVILHMGYDKYEKAGIEYIRSDERDPKNPEGLVFFGGSSEKGFEKSRLYPVIRNKHGHVTGFADFQPISKDPRDLR